MTPVTRATAASTVKASMTVAAASSGVWAVVAENAARVRLT
jgi:hypothetical protein